MTRTFLVALDLEPASDIDSIAADMLDSLASDSFPVTSVKPWASANTDQTAEELWSIGASDFGTLPPITTFLGQ
jgi:hypothetical protein